MNDHSYETILLTIDPEGVAEIIINRPDKLNALNKKVLDELDSVIDEIEKTMDIRGVIITGAGDKAFVAGADIAELSTLNSERGRAVSRMGQDIFSKIENLGKPVIAVVNGYALGGGCELAMACHLRIATPNAAFGLPEVGLGLIPGYGGTQRLPRLIGKGLAFEMIMTGKQLKAEKALSVGLVNKVVADEEAVNEAHTLMKIILGKGPVAISKAIQAVNSSSGNYEAGFEMEANLFGELCDTSDFREGTQAFLSKRSPNFTGN